MSGDDDDDGDGDGDRDRDRDRDRDADVVEAVSGVDCFGEGREHSSGVGFRRFRRLENQRTSLFFVLWGESLAEAVLSWSRRHREPKLFRLVNQVRDTAASVFRLFWNLSLGS